MRHTEDVFMHEHSCMHSSCIHRMTSYSTEEQPSEENLAVFFDQLRKERGFGSFTIGSKSNSCCSRTL